MTTPQGIKADPAALAAATNQYNALADTLNSTNQIVGGAEFIQNSSLWGGVGASNFEILSNAISSTYRRAGAGMQAASRATGELQSILEELIVLWNMADHEFKQIKAEYNATKARYRTVESELTATQATLAAEQTAMAAYHAQVASGNLVAIAPPQTPGLAAKIGELGHEATGLKSKMTHQEHEMERLTKAMLSLEDRASVAAGAYGETMAQIEAEWPSPQDVVAQSGGGGISLGDVFSAVVNYGSPVGWVGDVTGWYNAGKTANRVVDGLGNTASGFFSGMGTAAGAAATGLWTQMQADWDQLQGKLNTPAERRADANLNATMDMVANPNHAVTAFANGVSQHGLSYEMGQMGFMAGTAWLTHEALPAGAGLGARMLGDRVQSSVFRAIDVRSVNLGRANVLENVNWGGSGWTKTEFSAIKGLEVTKVFEKGVNQQLLVFANNEYDNGLVSSFIQSRPPDGMSVVSLHGQPTSATLSVNQLTTLIKEHGLADRPVCLLSCSTGRLPGATAFGQRLANALGQSVVAPTDLYAPLIRQVGHFEYGHWVAAPDPFRTYLPVKPS